jgi:DNA adenine methylase Dam
MTYVKSCINYTGGKYRLLKQILPLFPNKIDNFIDLFCGGANVALNVKSSKIHCFDIEKEIINLFNFIKKTDYDELLMSIENIIEKYGLSNTFKNGYNFYNCNSSSGLARYNKNSYIHLREDFNKLKYDSSDKYLYFYTLIIFAFNNQIRFNKRGLFNIPVGKRDFNKNSRNNLINFSEKIKEKKIDFKYSDFRNINLDKLKKNDFVYSDPPYLITTATYNEQNGWSEKDEKDLYNLLDFIDFKGIKFALSNVLRSKGKINNMLLEWSKKYNIHYLNYSYSNSNYQIINKDKTIEVLISNY